MMLLLLQRSVILALLEILEYPIDHIKNFQKVFIEFLEFKSKLMLLDTKENKN